MFSFRRLALLLALILTAAHVLQAQSTSSSSDPAPQDQAQTPTAAENQGQLSVQARIRARREQRRAQAIHDTYSHLYEVFVGGGYIRFTPGPTLQRVSMVSFDDAITRYFSEKLGVTIDGRGYFGTAYVGLNAANISKPAISQYGVLGGPTYRIYLRPKYSLSARAMGGLAMSNFAGDAGGFGPVALGLYPDSKTYAISGSLLGEANLSPNLSLRVGPEYYGTGFGSTMQNSIGFNYGIVYRFGKQ